MPSTAYVNCPFVLSHVQKTHFNQRLMHPPAYTHSPAQHLDYYCAQVDGWYAPSQIDKTVHFCDKNGEKKA